MIFEKYGRDIPLPKYMPKVNSWNSARILVLIINDERVVYNGIPIEAAEFKGGHQEVLDVGEQRRYFTIPQTPWIDLTDVDTDYEEL
jgi:hypothetical protein